MNFLVVFSYVFIRWTSTEEALERLASDFTRKYGKKNIFALVDGTHIEIKQPKINEWMYVNRKGWHSLNTMVTIQLINIVITLFALIS